MDQSDDYTKMEQAPTNDEIAQKCATEFMYYFSTMYREQYDASKKAHRSLRGHLHNSVKQALDKKSEALQALQDILKSYSSDMAEIVKTVKHIGRIQHNNRRNRIQEIAALVEEQRNPKPTSKPLTPIERMIDNACGVGVKDKPRISPKPKAKLIRPLAPKTPTKT